MRSVANHKPLPCCRCSTFSHAAKRKAFGLPIIVLLPHQNCISKNTALKT